MNSKLTALIFTGLLISTNASAFMWKSKNTTTDGHSYLMPKAVKVDLDGDGKAETVVKNQEAEEYLQETLDSLGITTYEREGVTYVKNNSEGLGLVKKGNKDTVFHENLKHFNKEDRMTWGNGKGLLKTMKKYTKKYGCIRKMTSLSHGWASDRTGEGHGLTGTRGYNGFYSDKASEPTGMGMKMAMRGIKNVDEDMRKMVEKGEIKFCNRCLVQFYACNISTTFARKFAEVSKCQTVISTGQTFPHFQKMSTSEEKFRVYNAYNHWTAGAFDWDERATVGWFRVTPIAKSWRSYRYIEENLGREYMAY
jgi:hypothetical protein